MANNGYPSWKGQVALVTGSGRGLGRAIALELASRGLAVVTNASRNSREAEETRNQVLELGVPSICIVCDLSNSAQVQDMYGRIKDEFGRLDVLVNNAGRNLDGPALTMTEAQWDTVVDTNLKAPFLCSQAAYPLMKAAGAGSIVNITARTAARPRQNGANYCSAKAGLSMLTKCLALEFAPLVRVNAIAPGTTETAEVVERFSLDTTAGMEAMLRPIPLKRISSPPEMAQLVCFVALDATFMTGAEIICDGGRNLT